MLFRSLQVHFLIFGLSVKVYLRKFRKSFYNSVPTAMQFPVHLLPLDTDAIYNALVLNCSEAEIDLGNEEIRSPAS